MSDPIKSVARVFEVFELFDEARAPLSASRVSKALDYPQSSALALLKSMVALGYLSFDRIERTYFPTLRMALLTDWLENSLYGEGDLHGLLDEISAATGETVALTVQNDLVMQFVHIRLGSQTFMLSIRPGATAPLFGSAIGLTALSERPDTEIAKYGERVNRSPRDGAKVDLDEIMPVIAAIRRDGYLVGYDMYVPSIGAICWPLPNLTGKRTLVLSVAGPRERIKTEENAIIRTTAAAIARYNAGRRTLTEKGLA